jgi:hypothetical protein
MVLQSVLLRVGALTGSGLGGGPQGRRGGGEGETTLGCQLTDGTQFRADSVKAL